MSLHLDSRNAVPSLYVRAKGRDLSLDAQCSVSIIGRFLARWSVPLETVLLKVRCGCPGPHV